MWLLLACLARYWWSLRCVRDIGDSRTQKAVQKNIKGASFPHQKLISRPSHPYHSIENQPFESDSKTTSSPLSITSYSR